MNNSRLDLPTFSIAHGPRSLGNLLHRTLCTGCLMVLGAGFVFAEEGPEEPWAAFSNGPDWKPLTSNDFVQVNTTPETWTWEDNQVHCTGKPVGVVRSREKVTNFEMVAEWRHLREAGNSGIFVWATDESIANLEKGKGRLPHGIEVQVLDLGYTKAYEKGGKKADWFTCHGDVFPCGVARMKPFPPVAPNGQRSFPSSNHSKGVNEWNHYYIRAINGEIRLWVNGHEVSGGTDCQPATGYLCLESEGAPVDFRNLKIRHLP